MDCAVFRLVAERRRGDTQGMAGFLDPLPRRPQHRVRNFRRVDAADHPALLGARRGEGECLCFRTTENGADEINDEVERRVVIVVDNDLGVTDAGRNVAHRIILMLENAGEETSSLKATR